jgi:hypothetical protein
VSKRRKNKQKKHRKGMDAGNLWMRGQGRNTRENSLGSLFLNFFFFNHHHHHKAGHFFMDANARMHVGLFTNMWLF